MGKRGIRRLVIGGGYAKVTLYPGTGISSGPFIVPIGKFIDADQKRKIAEIKEEHHWRIADLAREYHQALADLQAEFIKEIDVAMTKKQERRERRHD